FAPLIPSKEKQQIVFMGQINRKSILEPLFEALPAVIRQCPEAKALIIGDGKDLEYFRQKSKNLKIDSHVQFMGWLTLGEARACLRAGDIGYNYMPDAVTVKAANNMKVSQYMARGVVPLVSNTGDLPAMVDFGKAGYICKPDDVGAFETALLHAMNDGERLQKSKNARAFSEKTFSWDDFAAHFSSWLLKAEKNAGPRGRKIYVV